jgi:transposase
LAAEILEADLDLQLLLGTIAPNLLNQYGVGPTVAAQLLITAGDNPERIRSERAFAMLCGVAPVPASSGRTDRHRLNRGGDRQANTALHTVVVCRWAKQPRTRDYVQRRRAQGLGNAEIMRCLIGVPRPRTLRPRPGRALRQTTAGPPPSTLLIKGSLPTFTRV